MPGEDNRGGPTVDRVVLGSDRVGPERRADQVPLRFPAPARFHAQLS